MSQIDGSNGKTRGGTPPDPFNGEICAGSGRLATSADARIWQPQISGGWRTERQHAQDATRGRSAASGAGGPSDRSDGARGADAGPRTSAPPVSGATDAPPQDEQKDGRVQLQQARRVCDWRLQQTERLDASAAEADGRAAGGRGVGAGLPLNTSNSGPDSDSDSDSDSEEFKAALRFNSHIISYNGFQFTKEAEAREFIKLVFDSGLRCTCEGFSRGAKQVYRVYVK